MSQVRSIHAHRLSVFEAADVLPVGFLVAKAGPAVGAALFQKRVHTAAFGCKKEQLARVRIVKVNCVTFRYFAGFFDERRLLVVPAVLRVVSAVMVMMIKEASSREEQKEE